MAEKNDNPLPCDCCEVSLWVHVVYLTDFPWVQMIADGQDSWRADQQVGGDTCASFAIRQPRGYFSLQVDVARFPHFYFYAGHTASIPASRHWRLTGIEDHFVIDPIGGEGEHAPGTLFVELATYHL